MSSAAKRVLVVDNSAVVRHSISAMLLRIGCQMSEAEDGDEALRLIASQPPDLVILDLYCRTRIALKLWSRFAPIPPTRISRSSF